MLIFLIYYLKNLKILLITLNKFTKEYMIKNYNINIENLKDFFMKILTNIKQII